MFLSESDVTPSVLLAAHLSWAAESVTVQPRQFSALVYRLRGEGRFRPMGEPDTAPILSRAGDLFFLPAGMGYHAEYTEGEIYVFHIVLSRPAETIENLHLPEPERLLPYFRRAVAVFGEGGAGGRFDLLSLFYAVLAEIRRQEECIFTPALTRAVSILRAEFRDPALRVETVSKRAGISDGHLRRLIWRRYGMSPIAFLTELRLTEATRQLQKAACSVEQAAIASGFSDAKYFSRVVRKYRGCTPGALRGART